MDRVQQALKSVGVLATPPCARAWGVGADISQERFDLLRRVSLRALRAAVRFTALLCDDALQPRLLRVMVANDMVVSWAAGAAYGVRRYVANHGAHGFSGSASRRPGASPTRGCRALPLGRM